MIEATHQIRMDHAHRCPDCGARIVTAQCVACEARQGQRVYAVPQTPRDPADAITPEEIAARAAEAREMRQKVLDRKADAIRANHWRRPLVRDEPQEEPDDEREFLEWLAT
jgi:predicted NBD/HSP70 family sugar kinase